MHIKGKKMNHHIEAWGHVEKYLFGTVCEVVKNKPWGFKEDRDDIITRTVDEFLKENNRYDTVLLHILSGEGESKNRILKVLDKAYKNSVKIVILEHNIEEFNGLNDIKFIEDVISDEEFIYENWGRNLLYSFTTLYPLCLPQLSDKYLKENINKTYVNEDDHGICANNLIYTHTSEQPIDFELPKEEIIWVIGGGIPYESMREGDILIDSVLRQCIYSAKLLGVEEWKLDRLYKFKPIREIKEIWLPHWRKVKMNGIKPRKILHKGLDDLDVSNKVIYISTVHKDFWGHLEKNNKILDAWTEPRDIIKL